MNDLFQLAIIAVILLGIFVAWRAGQANPEGTGRLARRIGNVEKELQGKASGAAVAELAKEVAELKSEMIGDRRVNQMTYDAVRRLEDYFLKKGTGAQ